eukprot:TRINITY_DN11063_c0_g3_i2.p2 TRINITY_DN11063_c0_g3~~TRINITY_DN11063_c0_g3_i2.p2  ORF type:complete len:102 (+),score=9.87 TRINITY_DN11063_c0_g3_i2:39-308(+)
MHISIAQLVIPFTCCNFFMSGFLNVYIFIKRQKVNVTCCQGFNLPPCCEQMIVGDNLCGLAEEANIDCGVLIQFNGDYAFDEEDEVQVC